MLELRKFEYPYAASLAATGKKLWPRGRYLRSRRASFCGLDVTVAEKSSLRRGTVPRAGKMGLSSFDSGRTLGLHRKSMEGAA